MTPESDPYPSHVIQSYTIRYPLCKKRIQTGFCKKPAILHEARGRVQYGWLNACRHQAFDVVPHARLLYKLEFYGIKGATLRWISSFLHERTQRVVVDDQTSDEAPVTSGVPQGSVLGPILFLVYINDMPEYIKSSCRLFADDSIIYRVIQGLRDCATLQDDLDRLHQWELDWGMLFNPSKCNIMNVSKSPNCKPNKYSLKGVVLETIPNAPYLGVNISSNLSWRHHIKKCSAKANRTLGFVRRNRRGATHTAKAQAYISLVRPQLEYCSTIWSPHQQKLVWTTKRHSNAPRSELGDSGTKAP